jgi:septum formation protein
MSTAPRRIYLASRSPRRRELLKQAGIAFEVLLYREDPRRGLDVDETPLPGELPNDYVSRLAHAKVHAAVTRLHQRRLPAFPVLGADTTVVVDQRILGKPRDTDDAIAMLTALADRGHEVLTAVALGWQDRIEVRLSVSAVEFGPMSARDIARYVASGEHLDKAGAYAIQGRAGTFVRRISGSYTGVMGLPLYETSQLLKACGLGEP